MFRLLVAGGRDYYNYELISTTLTNWYDEIDHKELEGLTIVHGDAAGADRIAAQWARYNSFKVEPHPADWPKFGKMGGSIRNSQMIESGINYAILFPGGRGTNNMKNQLIKAKIKFREVLDLNDEEEYTRY